MSLLLVFLLGVVSGLRTFTAPAVLWIMRHGGFLAYALSAAALFEYYLDVQPNTPSRTGTVGMVCRLLSGAFVGWWGAAATGISSPLGAIAGAFGAVLGTYGSFAARKRLSDAIGNMASGIVEDIITIAAAVAIVAEL